jgi:hypothetical protein
MWEGKSVKVEFLLVLLLVNDKGTRVHMRNERKGLNHCLVQLIILFV